MPKLPPNPPLSLITGDNSGISPPRPLDRHGMSLWTRVQAEYRISDTGGVEILAQICSALDRAESLAEAIASSGGPVVVTRSGVPKAHPGVKDELACRAFICRSLERLGLNIEPVRAPGCPPKVGWRP